MFREKQLVLKLNQCNSLNSEKKFLLIVLSNINIVFNWDIDKIPT